MINVIANADNKTVKFWVRYGDLVKGDFQYGNGSIAYYHPTVKKVFLNIDVIDERSKRINQTKDVRAFYMRQDIFLMIMYCLMIQYVITCRICEKNFALMLLHILTE